MSCAFTSVRAQDYSYQNDVPDDSSVYPTTDYKFYKKDGTTWDKTIHSGLTMGGTGYDFIIKSGNQVITDVNFDENDFVRITYVDTASCYHITALKETNNSVIVGMSINGYTDRIEVSKIKPLTSNNNNILNKKIESLESVVLQYTNQIDSLYRYIQAQKEKIEQLTFKHIYLSNDLECLLTEKSEEIKKGRMMMITIIIVITIIILLFIKNRKLYVRTKDLSSELNTSKQQLERNTNIISNNNISDTNNNYIVVNELKKQIGQLQLEISTLKDDNNLLQKKLDELNTLKQQFEEKTSTIPNNSIDNTDELKKTIEQLQLEISTLKNENSLLQKELSEQHVLSDSGNINTNREEITEEKKNNVVQYTQEHNSFSLYSDFIVDGIFNKVTETPNEDTVYELILDNGNGCSASVIIYQGAYSRILANRSFIDGCEIQIVGKNEVCIEKDGLAEKDNNGKWKLVRVPSIVIK